MSERGLSEEAMLASLRDIRLPNLAPGGWVADFAVSIGFAAVAALVLVSVLLLFSRRQRIDKPEDISAALAKLDGLPEAERRVALLHLLRAHAPDRYEAYRARLYRPDTAPALEDLETEAARLV